MKQQTNAKFVITALLLNSCALLADAAQDSVIHITSEEQYQSLLKDSKPSVIKFAAEWCGACQSVKEPFAQVANDPELKDVNFVHVNIDDFQKLAQENGVVGIPTFLYVQNGSSKHQEVGVKNPAVFQDSVRENIRAHFNSTVNQAVDAHDTHAMPEEHKEGALQHAEERAKEMAMHAEEESMAAAHRAEAEAKEMAQHAETGFMGVLAKIKAMFMMIFEKVKDLIMSVVHWIKGLFGR